MLVLLFGSKSKVHAWTTFMKNELDDDAWIFIYYGQNLNDHGWISFINDKLRWMNYHILLWKLWHMFNNLGYVRSLMSSTTYCNRSNMSLWPCLSSLRNMFYLLLEWLTQHILGHCHTLFACSKKGVVSFWPSKLPPLLLRVPSIMNDKLRWMKYNILLWKLWHMFNNLCYVRSFMSSITYCNCLNMSLWPCLSSLHLEQSYNNECLEEQ